jgi:hypothetical protein
VTYLSVSPGHQARGNLMMGTQICSSRVLSLLWNESGDEEHSVLPRNTKVIVTGNNRTKSVLVGLQGVVKKAVGLGGWHWLVSIPSYYLVIPLKLCWFSILYWVFDKRENNSELRTLLLECSQAICAGYCSFFRSYNFIMPTIQCLMLSACFDHPKLRGI